MPRAQRLRFYLLIWGVSSLNDHGTPGPDASSPAGSTHTNRCNVLAKRILHHTRDQTVAGLPDKKGLLAQPLKERTVTFPLTCLCPSDSKSAGYQQRCRPLSTSP